MNKIEGETLERTKNKGEITWLGFWVEIAKETEIKAHIVHTKTEIWSLNDKLNTRYYRKLVYFENIFQFFFYWLFLTLVLKINKNNQPKSSNQYSTLVTISEIKKYKSINSYISIPKNLITHFLLFPGIIWKEQVSSSSTFIIAPELLNSPQ